MDHEEFVSQIKKIEACAPGGSVSLARTYFIPATQPPWLDTGIDLEAGDQISTFCDGRIYLSEELDLWFHPEFQVWHRIGEAGEIARGARPTNTVTAESGGRLFICGLFGGDWKDRTGGLATSVENYENGVGGVSVAVIKWQADPEMALRAIADKGVQLALDELERLSDGVPVPDGWSYLWEIGKGEMFDQKPGEHGTTMCCHALEDVGILQKDVDCALTPSTRLKWKWKIDALPSPVAEDTIFTHDYLSIALEFENGRDLSYYWSSELPVETSYHCPLPNWTHRETHLVIRSGLENLGEWFSEDRNVYDDYLKAIGEPPSRIVRVWFISVSIFQRKEGQCEYADIVIENGDQEMVVLGG